MAATLHRMNHPHPGFMAAETGFSELPGHNINDNNYDDPNMKTFYTKKSDSMSTGPYATTVLLRTPNDQVTKCLMEIRVDDSETILIYTPFLHLD